MFCIWRLFSCLQNCDSLALIPSSLTQLLPAHRVLLCQGLGAPGCRAYQMHGVELDGVFLGIPLCCHCNGQGLAGHSEELGLGRFQFPMVQVYFEASWGIRVEILGNQRGAGTKEQQTTPQQEQNWSSQEHRTRDS